MDFKIQAGYAGGWIARARSLAFVIEDLSARGVAHFIGTDASSIGSADAGALRAFALVLEEPTTGGPP